MSDHPSALILWEPVRPELLALLDGYIHTSHNLSYLLCSNVEPLGAFVLAHAVKDKDTPSWPVQIPVGCVAAIADMSKPKAGPGFLSAAQ